MSGAGSSPRRGALVSACTAIALSRAGMAESSDAIVRLNGALEAMALVPGVRDSLFQQIEGAAHRIVDARIDGSEANFTHARDALAAALAVYWDTRAQQALTALGER